jgi:hypothetical protein
MLARYMGAVGRPFRAFPGFGCLFGVCGFRKCEIGPWSFKEIVHCRISGSTQPATLRGSF